MIIDVNRYSSSLKKLWSEVFGDSPEYIGLLFDKDYTVTECFGEIVEGEVVSALYLLSCSIQIKETTFKGRYLYAAATLEQYRGQGLMARLIREAQGYISAEGIDFISLVPANDGLYNYYGRFGFVTSMYNYHTLTDKEKNLEVCDEIIDDIKTINEMRRKYSGNSFIFDEKEMNYAYNCLGYAGFSFYRNSEDSYYLADKDKSEVIEYISSKENFFKNTLQLFSKLSKGASIASPYNLSDFAPSDIRRYGMVYQRPGSKDINSEKIYMNIALD